MAFMSLSWYAKACSIVVCLFVCFGPHEQFFSNLSAVTITADGAADLDLCIALMTFCTESYFMWHTFCDTGPRSIQSHPKDWHPRPTLVFEPATQGSSDLCTAASCYRYMYIISFEIEANYLTKRFVNYDLICHYNIPLGRMLSDVFHIYS
jgi:hypothetical protein